MRALLFGGVVCLGAACLLPPNGTSLGSNLNSADAGQDSGTPLPENDGGAVAPLTALPSSECHAARLDAGCTGCVTLHRAGVAPEVVASGADWPAADTIHFTVGSAGDGLVFATQSSAGQGSTLWLARSGLPPLALRSTVVGEDFSEVAAVAQAGSELWLVADRYAGTFSFGRDVLRSTGGAATAVATMVSHEVTSNGAVMGSSYFVGLADGVHEYTPAGDSLYAASTEVVALTADAAGVVFVTCPLVRTVACKVWSAPRGSAPGVLAQLSELRSAAGSRASVVVRGGDVWVLGATTLWRLPRAGGPAVAMYTGTLKPSSLKLQGGKLYFGAACEADTSFASVELDPAARSARWLNLDPAYPLVPYLTAFEAFREESTTFATPLGVYQVR